MESPYTISDEKSIALHGTCMDCGNPKKNSRSFRCKSCSCRKNKLGTKQSEETKKLRAEKLKGNRNALGYKHTKEAKKKISQASRISSIGNRRALGTKRSLEHRILLRELHLGEKCIFWQGGVSKENRRLRTGLGYKIWREAVFSRDDYTCQECKARGGELNADHIKPFALFPEFRLELSNGRTLCVPCHRKTDTWGRKTLVLKK